MDFLNDIYNGSTSNDMFVTNSSTYDALNNLSPAQTVAVGSVLFVWMFIGLAICIVSIIGLWKLFKKAGEKGWKSIIPIYNIVILYKISGLSPLLLLIFLIGFIPVIGWFALPLISIVLQIVLSIKLSKSFGKAGGYAVGLIFLPTIFYLILGFGKAEYVGPNGEKTVIAKTPTNDDTTTQK